MRVLIPLLFLIAVVLTGRNIFYEIPADCEFVDRGWFQEPIATNCTGI